MKAKIVLALALILVLLMASSASMAAKGVVAPFRAYVLGPCELVSCDENGVCTYNITGEGRATHLGKIDMVGVSVLDTSQGLPYPYFSDQTFTAANGDEFYISVVGTFTGDSPQFLGTFEITGGTGRFEGVTGGGDFWAYYDGTLGSAYYDGMPNRP